MMLQLYATRKPVSCLPASTMSVFESLGGHNRRSGSLRTSNLGRDESRWIVRKTTLKYECPMPQV